MLEYCCELRTESANASSHRMLSETDIRLIAGVELVNLRGKHGDDYC